MTKRSGPVAEIRAERLGRLTGSDAICTQSPSAGLGVYKEIGTRGDTE